MRSCDRLDLQFAIALDVGMTAAPADEAPPRMSPNVNKSCSRLLAKHTERVKGHERGAA